MTATDQTYFDGREMYMVHRYFRRELGLMPGLVRAVAAGDGERAGIVIQHLSGVTDTLRHHHHGEDIYVWPKLLDRAPAELAPGVHLMEQQHQGIDQAAAEADSAVEVWRDGATAESRDSLAASLDTLNSRVVEHMATEEQHVVPVMEKYITETEWNASLQEMAADIDPGTLPLSFGMLMYEGDAELIERAIDSMPPDVRPIIGEVAGKAFTAHAEMIHGTATPKRSTEL